MSTPDDQQRPSDPETGHPSQAEGTDPDMSTVQPDPEESGHPSQAEGDDA